MAQENRMTLQEINLNTLEGIKKNVDLGWRLHHELMWVITELEKRLIKEKEDAIGN